jgi:hypothetical protein
MGGGGGYGGYGGGGGYAGYGGTGYTGSGYGTGGGRGGEFETESDPSGGMGGVKHGGWTSGPMSGYPVMHHGTEYTLNADQIKAVRELGLSRDGSGSQVIHLILEMPWGDRLEQMINVQADKVRVKAEEMNAGTTPLYLG